ncbi:hypothetical protein BABINDRAFT_161994 [Babjeviella inositovora NRRL Y-12698]|uniref:Uncharacterized protein n=1 Tax=Babjeviella inositovora NRRL Y-12698 TaxID=984486 RepID=A0A1E3QPM4_9ASCO|nr:uncharacterized protein BABINDRAFT_161994 [Babjeviella inositovora NRRL Y-12698]ODQ79611.1 hypothetical protein BABINDRAFT_161994 [Babjeviella inositovora NRRL Y-12698]
MHCLLSSSDLGNCGVSRSLEILDIHSAWSHSSLVFSGKGLKNPVINSRLSRVGFQHCLQPLLLTIAINHCHQILPSTIAINHCHQPLLSAIAIKYRHSFDNVIQQCTVIDQEKPHFSKDTASAYRCIDNAPISCTAPFQFTGPQFHIYNEYHFKWKYCSKSNQTVSYGAVQAIPRFNTATRIRRSTGYCTMAGAEAGSFGQHTIPLG